MNSINLTPFHLLPLPQFPHKPLVAISADSGYTSAGVGTDKFLIVFAVPNDVETLCLNVAEAQILLNLPLPFKVVVVFAPHRHAGKYAG